MGNECVLRSTLLEQKEERLRGRGAMTRGEAWTAVHMHVYGVGLWVVGLSWVV